MSRRNQTLCRLAYLIAGLALALCIGHFISLKEAKEAHWRTRAESLLEEVRSPDFHDITKVDELKGALSLAGMSPGDIGTSEEELGASVRRVLDWDYWMKMARYYSEEIKKESSLRENLSGWVEFSLEAARKTRLGEFTSHPLGPPVNVPGWWYTWDPIKEPFEFYEDFSRVREHLPLTPLFL